MDLKEMIEGGAAPWTEERHSSFLNWVENCFVRRILHAGDAGATIVPVVSSCSAADGRSHSPLDRDVEVAYHLPLNRYLPDSATESTRDTPIAAGFRRTNRPQPYSRAHPASAMEQGKDKSTMTYRDRTRKRRPLLPQYDALQEQQADNYVIKSEKIVDADGACIHILKSFSLSFLDL